MGCAWTEARRFIVAYDFLSCELGLLLDGGASEHCTVAGTDPRRAATVAYRRESHAYFHTF
jgi:hypothetical protein